MPKNKKNNNNDIKITREDSGLAEFIKRPLPTSEEVEEFEEMIEGSAIEDDFSNGEDDEIKDEEIDESLSEIYQDNDGQVVDVKKFDIKKRHGFFFYFFLFIFIVGGLAGAGYAAYKYIYLGVGSDATAVDFFIEGKETVAAGEEFFYTVHLGCGSGFHPRFNW